ncbi:MAG: DUF1214 domain-containing protein [Gammaproteobacteria bacterium]
MKTPPVEQVAKMDAETFFNRLAMLMQDNPPAAEDAEMLLKLASIGIIPGEPFSLEGRPPVYVETLEHALKTAQRKISSTPRVSWQWENHWWLAPVLGDYGTNYDERAAIAMYGLGANLAEDAIYPMAQEDGQGKKLNGHNRYIIHFPKDAIPPVNAFWSLTLYDEDQLFVENELKRYAIGDRDDLHYNADGSLDIYIQHESPKGELASNWLPSPEENFSVFLRLYWPKDEVLRGDWLAPAIYSY